MADNPEAWTENSNKKIVSPGKIIAPGQVEVPLEAKVIPLGGNLQINL